MVQYNLHPITMFELIPVGFPIAIVGLVYMLLLGDRLVPDRIEPENKADEFGLRPYLTEVILLPGSNLCGKMLGESGLGRDLDLTVLRVVRDKTQYLAPSADLILEDGDVLLVEGLRDEILKIKDIAGINIKADFKLSDPDLQSEDTGLVEVILMQRSPLIGRTLKGMRFRERYGLQVLAVHRGEGFIRRKISQAPLRMGDVLLVQGHKRNIALMQEDRTFQFMGVVNERRPNLRRAPIAIVIFVGMLVASTFEILPLPVAMLLGALLVFITRCITPEEAYREVEWKALILIGSMLAFGVAMEQTGAAAYLAGHITTLVGALHPVWLLGGFFLLTVLLTQPMSNQAAAVVVLPVAIQTALQLGLNPRTFAIMIAVAASCSYLTPLEPSCLMVYGPGHYKFIDFLKVGFILTVLIFLIAIVLVPMIWPIG
jgi:di/tricarboxylate transporter